MENMRLIDTHAHLFDETFAEDLGEVVERARKRGVEKIFLPQILHAFDLDAPASILQGVQQHENVKDTIAAVIVFIIAPGRDHTIFFIVPNHFPGQI